MKAAAVTSVPAYAHVRELRGRLSWCVGVLVLGGAVGYLLRIPVINLLQRPLGQELFYTSPSGSFEFIMRVCFLVGFLLALPVIVYHLLRFIEPALPKSLSRRLVAAVIVSSFALMAAGVSFGYFVSLPAALHFFNNVGDGSLKALITADQYFTFVVNYLAIFAAVFQLPLLLVFINKIKPLGPTMLRKYRKFVIAGSFIVALFVPSAPDPLSQLILAMPIIALYEVSIWLIWSINRRAQRKATALVKAATKAENKLAAKAAKMEAKASAKLRGVAPASPAMATATAPVARRRSAQAMARPQARPRPAIVPSPVAAPAARAAMAPAYPSAATIDLSQVPVSRPSTLVPPGHIIDLRPSAAH